MTTEMKKATMYREGNNWIVSTWDASVQCYRLSGGLSYWAARAAVGTANCRDPKRCELQTHHHEEEG